MQSPFSPRPNRSNTVAQSLRQQIFAGDLKPGDKLPTEAVLCEQYGVSRTTLREAIQMLRTHGLLDVTPGRGSFIRSPDIHQIMEDITLVFRTGRILPEEVKTLRLLLQKDILARLHRVQPARKKLLYQHVLIRAAAAEDNAQLEANWHCCMAELAGNTLQKFVLEILLALEVENRTRTYRDPDEVMKTIHIQMRTNNAITDGDYALAERVLCQFIDPHTSPVPTGLKNTA